MRRREFITPLGGTVVAWPLKVRAQQPLPVIGFLNSRSAKDSASVDFVAAFRQGLGDLGFVEARGVAIEYRWAEGEYQRLPAMATDLTSRQVACIAAASACGTSGGAEQDNSDCFQRRRRSGRAWPRHCPQPAWRQSHGCEPVRLSVGSEALGAAARSSPQATAIVFLVNPTNAIPRSIRVICGGRAHPRVELHVFNASTESEIDAAFAGWSSEPVNSSFSPIRSSIVGASRLLR